MNERRAVYADEFLTDVVKRRIAYLEQRGRELERILHAVDAQLAKSGHTVELRLMMGVTGDEFLTDVNRGRADFGFTNIKGLDEGL